MPTSTSPTSGAIVEGSGPLTAEEAQECHDNNPDTQCGSGNSVKVRTCSDLDTDQYKNVNSTFDNAEYYCGYCPSTRRALEAGAEVLVYHEREDGGRILLAEKKVNVAEPIAPSNTVVSAVVRENDVETYISSVIESSLPARDTDNVSDDLKAKDESSSDQEPSTTSFWVRHIASRWRRTRDEDSRTDSGVQIDVNDEEDEPYCVAEDFPCEGDSMVHICHYSSYQGYQTLCVHESKTDIIAYYKNDYCGPCAGGFASLFRREF